VRELFSDHMELLANHTVAFPVVFFRSKNWDEIPRSIRPKMKQFCFPIVREILQKIHPQRMLVISFKAYGYLDRRILGDEARCAFEERIPSPRRRSQDRLFEESQWNSPWGVVPVLGILHLTGALGVSTEELEMLGKKLEGWLSTED